MKIITIFLDIFLAIILSHFFQAILFFFLTDHKHPVLGVTLSLVSWYYVWRNYFLFSVFFYFYCCHLVIYTFLSFFSLYFTRSLIRRFLILYLLKYLFEFCHLNNQLSFFWFFFSNINRLCHIFYIIKFFL